MPALQLSFSFSPAINPDAWNKAGQCTAFAQGKFHKMPTMFQLKFAILNQAGRLASVILHRVPHVHCRGRRRRPRILPTSGYSFFRPLGDNFPAVLFVIDDHFKWL
jgi:hypothetical protein